MKEIDIIREARLIAHETILMHFGNVLYRLIGATEDRIAEAERDALDQARLQPVLDVDPAMSDMISAEVEEQLKRLFLIGRDQRGVQGHSRSPERGSGGS